MSFRELKLVEPLQRALEKEGYEHPTPIQEKAIPHILEGRDLLGCAQTGTGKTAAFSLPLLQRLAEKKAERRIRALVLSPTRELAAQIGERVGAYGRHLGLGHAVVFGGVSQFHQVRSLNPLPAVLVATPGRLLDLTSQRLVDLSHVEILVLDEADRMLDMGFIHDVKKIVAMTPRTRQTLLFSATMPSDIVSLARSILVDPVRVDVAPDTRTADRVEQHVYFVARPDKKPLLLDLLADPAVERVLVFTRTKHGASRVAQQLDRAGVRANAIHGDKTQGARERALSEFKGGVCRVLVATDIAARGIDVEGVTHVINYELPNSPDSYVHRIGRTGRAGASGIALSFCDAEEKPLLTDIEKFIGKRLPSVDHSRALPAGAMPAPKAKGESRQGGGRGGGQRGGGQRGGGQRGPAGGRDYSNGGRSFRGPAGPRNDRDRGGPARPTHAQPVGQGRSSPSRTGSNPGATAPAPSRAVQGSGDVAVASAPARESGYAPRRPGKRWSFGSR